MNVVATGPRTALPVLRVEAWRTNRPPTSERRGSVRCGRVVSLSDSADGAVAHREESLGWLNCLCGGGQSESCGQAHHHGDDSASKHNALLWFSPDVWWRFYRIGEGP